MAQGVVEAQKKVSKAAESVVDTTVNTAGAVAKGAAQAASTAGSVVDTTVTKAGVVAQGAADVVGKVADGVVDTTTKLADTSTTIAKGAKGVATGAATIVVQGVHDQVVEIKDSIYARVQAPLELVDAVTPEDRWFTPESGWPTAPSVAELDASITPDPKVYKPQQWRPPANLCPTATEMPSHFQQARRCAR